jgi:hypothetical protein
LALAFGHERLGGYGPTLTILLTVPAPDALAAVFAPVPVEDLRLRVRRRMEQAAMCGSPPTKPSQRPCSRSSDTSAGSPTPSWQAVHLGGDTDTIAAMTGALAGAFHGVAAIPERCRARLERVSVSTPWPMICSRRCETAFRNLGGTATGRRQRAGIHTRKRAPPPLAVRDTVTPPL